MADSRDAPRRPLEHTSEQLKQRSPTFLVPGPGFAEDTDADWGGGGGGRGGGGGIG